MKRYVPVSVLGLLATAGLVFGQAPAAPVALDPDVLSALPPPEAPRPAPMAVGSGPAPGWVLTTQAEYLLWWLQRETLASTVAVSDPALATQPSTLTNFDRDLTGQPLSGARFTLGLWQADYDPVLESAQGLVRYGAEVNGFFLAERSASFTSGAIQQIFRPFFNLNSGVADAFVVAFPGLAVGELSGTTKFDFWGSEANVLGNVFNNPPSQTVRIDLLAGFRYLDFDSSLQINQNTSFNPNLAGFPGFAALAGSRLQAFDFFGTENQYYGGQVGLRARFLFGCASVGTNLKYGIGTTNQRLTINGGQLLTPPTGPQTVSTGGLLALPSNIGTFSRNRFSQVPEANLNLNINLSERLSLQAGYTFLYISRVIRAGNQIDRVIDITQIPNAPGAAGALPTGLNRPGVFFRETGLLVQGLNFGLTFSW